MRPDNKSESFTFHRNEAVTSSDRSDDRHSRNCRQKLHFDQASGTSSSDRQVIKNTNIIAPRAERRAVLSSLSLNDTKKAFKSGAERISKTFTTVRTTFGTISQKFKTSTKRRQILEEGPVTPNCATPHTYSRVVLGRTPCQMYSPFDIDSTDERRQDKENNLTPIRSPNETSGSNTNWLKKRNLLDSINSD